MTLDLNLHSFLSVFNNNTDNNRGIIIGNLEKALLNPNTPDYIIISIPALCGIFSTAPLSPLCWLIVSALSLTPVLVVETEKLLAAA